MNRKRHVAELELKRAELEKQAKALESEARPLKDHGAEGDRRSFLLSEARVLREEAREVALQLASLTEEDRS